MLQVSLRPRMSLTTIALLLLMACVLPAGKTVVAAPDKLNLAESQTQWKDIVPSNGELARSARIAALIYQIDSVDSPAWEYSKETLKPTVFLKNQKGVEAAVVISESAKTIHVVFRGTDGSVVDIGVDLQLRMIPYSAVTNNGRTFVDGKVHEGFKLSLEDMQLLVRLDNAVQDALELYPAFRFELNGHSLGAAQAVIYGVHLATTVLPSQRINVVTIGSPRVGDLDFKEAANAIPNLAVWRMVNRDDLIPRLPMNVLEYHHIGHLIWFTRGGGMSVYYQQTGLKNIYEGVDSADWDIDLVANPLVPIFNHMPWEYEMLVGELAVSLTAPATFVPSDGVEDTCCFWVAICLRYCSE